MCFLISSALSKRRSLTKVQQTQNTWITLLVQTKGELTTQFSWRFTVTGLFIFLGLVKTESCFQKWVLVWFESTSTLRNQRSQIHFKNLRPMSMALTIRIKQKREQRFLVCNLKFFFNFFSTNEKKKTKLCVRHKFTDKSWK